MICADKFVHLAGQNFALLDPWELANFSARTTPPFPFLLMTEVRGVFCVDSPWSLH